jgi:hypothetical protein
MASIRGLSPDGLAQLVELTEARAYADLFRDAPTSWGVRLVESELATVLARAGSGSAPRFHLIVAGAHKARSWFDGSRTAGIWAAGAL